MTTALIKKYNKARLKMHVREKTRFAVTIFKNVFCNQKIGSVLSWTFGTVAFCALIYGWLALTAMDAQAEADAQRHAEAQMKTRLFDIFPDPVIAAYKKEYGHE